MGPVDGEQDHLARAVELDQDDLESIVHLGSCQNRLGRYQDVSTCVGSVSTTCVTKCARCCWIETVRAGYSSGEVKPRGIVWGSRDCSLDAAQDLERDPASLVRLSMSAPRQAAPHPDVPRRVPGS